MPPMLEDLVTNQQDEDRLEDERGYAKFIRRVRLHLTSQVEVNSPAQKLKRDTNPTAYPAVAIR